MPKRITIVLDDDNNKKLRAIQAKALKDSSNSVSFSRIINQEIRKSK